MPGSASPMFISENNESTNLKPLARLLWHLVQEILSWLVVIVGGWMVWWLVSLPL